MAFPKQIFKAYDIRGLVKGELSPNLAYQVGRAFVVFLRSRNYKLGGKSVVVGYDMRESSELFKNEVMRGINDEGADVSDIGLTTTPLFNFSCAHFKEHVGGIMVTASHNPAEYNGFKLTLDNGLPVGQNNGMNEIRDLVEAGKFEDKKKGNITKKDVFAEYQRKIFSLVEKGSIKPLQVVIDAGNGMAKITIPKILEQLPVKAEYLFLEPNGRFPNHEANPLKVETLKKLQEEVIKQQADFGFALDGDCDRIGLVDEKGEVVPASYVGALLGLEVLRKHPGGLMLYDLRSSSIVPEVWEQNGAKTRMCMVGHANIKREMKVSGVVFASELSQHLYYSDLYDLESSDLSLLYLLELLSRENKPLSQIIAPLNKYFHSGEINFTVENKEAMIKKIEEKYRPKALETIYLDGLWMKFDWGWFSVRGSNTEPVLRLNLEAKNKKDMEDKVEEMKKIIQS